MTCRHVDVVPVVPIGTNETVAALCVDCGLTLHAAWGCGDCDYVEIFSLGSQTPMRVMGQLCEAHR